MGKGGGGGSIAKSSIQSAATQFWQSQGARKAVFKQLESALRTGGGPGFKSGVVQTGIARSRAAGMDALRNAGTATAGLDPSIRSRLLNRISQSTAGAVNRMGPSFANALIGQAAPALGAGAGASADAMRVAASGEIAGLEASAARAQGIANAVASGASGAGYLAGKYLKKPDAPDPNVAQPTTSPATNPSSWYQRFFGGA